MTNTQTIKPPRFVIMNCTDKPCIGLVAQWIEGVGYCYMSQKLPGLEHRANYNGMTPMAGTTSMEDFGFKIEERGDAAVIFEKIEPSKATYHDGAPRDWQDDTGFGLPNLDGHKLTLKKKA